MLRGVVRPAGLQRGQSNDREAETAFAAAARSSRNICFWTSTAQTADDRRGCF
jgi:hypothetical protein